MVKYLSITLRRIRAYFMKRLVLSEKHLVVVLFVIVLVVFSFAQEDTRKIEKMYLDTTTSATSQADENIKSDLKEGKMTPAAELR
jgi:hypothetical protein